MAKSLPCSPPGLQPAACLQVSHSLVHFSHAGMPPSLSLIHIGSERLTGAGSVCRVVLLWSIAPLNLFESSCQLGGQRQSLETVAAVESRDFSGDYSRTKTLTGNSLQAVPPALRFLSMGCGAGVVGDFL